MVKNNRILTNIAGGILGASLLSAPLAYANTKSNMLNVIAAAQPSEVVVGTPVTQPTLTPAELLGADKVKTEEDIMPATTSAQAQSRKEYPRKWELVLGSGNYYGEGNNTSICSDTIKTFDYTPSKSDKTKLVQDKVEDRVTRFASECLSEISSGKAKLYSSKTNQAIDFTKDITATQSFGLSLSNCKYDGLTLGTRSFDIDQSVLANNTQGETEYSTLVCDITTPVENFLTKTQEESTEKQQQPVVLSEVNTEKEFYIPLSGSISGKPSHVKSIADGNYEVTAVREYGFPMGGKLMYTAARPTEIVDSETLFESHTKELLSKDLGKWGASTFVKDAFKSGLYSDYNVDLCTEDLDKGCFSEEQVIEAGKILAQNIVDQYKSSELGEDLSYENQDNLSAKIHQSYAGYLSPGGNNITYYVTDGTGMNLSDLVLSNSERINCDTQNYSTSEALFSCGVAQVAQAYIESNPEVKGAFTYSGISPQQIPVRVEEKSAFSGMVKSLENTLLGGNN
jgi:hypothetical protein